MKSRDKLEMAEYHLERMKQVVQNNPKAFNAEFESFLWTLESSLDIILMDINDKYGLGLKEEKKVYADLVRKTAEGHQKQGAIDFLDWYEQERETLDKDPLYDFFFKQNIGLRDLSTHKRTTHPKRTEHIVNETIGISDTVTVTKFRVDQDGKLIPIEEPALLELEPTSQPPAPSESTTRKFFSEYPNEEVMSGCTRIFAVAKRIVLEAEERYNKP